MSNPYTWFWTVMIVLSIVWYAVLLFYVSFKGGREIIQLTDSLADRQREEQGGSG